MHDGSQITQYSYVQSYELMLKDYQQLPQLKFWCDVVQCVSDSSIINIASSRTGLYKVCTAQWQLQTEAQKLVYKDSVKKFFQIDSLSSLYVTAGKREFYEFKKAAPLISDGIKAFKKIGVDPWYAQAILLIESPGKLHAVSSAGARGPFQLMPEVARAFGLKVNRKVDERTNFERSAMAASKFIKVNCIPFSKRLCESSGITYNENDLWFKLLTMHIYNAGFGNVKAAVDKLCPGTGGVELIKGLWQTEAAQFKNQSQNYSQIVLACMNQYQKMMHQSDTIFLSDGDALMTAASKLPPALKVITLKKCIKAYELDLIDGIITADQFKGKLECIQNEMQYYSKAEASTITAMDLNRVGNKLMSKRNMKEAIEIFKYNENLYPENKMVYDSLQTAYTIVGNKAMAKKYALLSSKNPSVSKP